MYSPSAGIIGLSLRSIAIYLGAVSVHVSRASVTPAPVSPLLTGLFPVFAVQAALVTGLGTVDQHPLAVLPALAFIRFGPIFAMLVSVLAALLRSDGGLHSSARDGATSNLGIAGTLVESVDLPDISVRETLSLSYPTLAGLLLYDGLQPPGLNRNRTSGMESF